MAEKRAASPTNCEQAVNEIGGRLGNLHGLPPQLGRRGGAVRSVEFAQKLAMAGDPGLERFVGHRGFDPVKPTAKQKQHQRCRMENGFDYLKRFFFFFGLTCGD